MTHTINKDVVHLVTLDLKSQDGWPIDAHRSTFYAERFIVHS